MIERGWKEAVPQTVQKRLGKKFIFGQVTTSTDSDLRIRFITLEMPENYWPDGPQV